MHAIYPLLSLFYLLFVECVEDFQVYTHLHKVLSHVVTLLAGTGILATVATVSMQTIKSSSSHICRECMNGQYILKLSSVRIGMPQIDAVWWSLVWSLEAGRGVGGGYLKVRQDWKSVHELLMGQGWDRLQCKHIYMSERVPQSVDLSLGQGVCWNGCIYIAITLFSLLMDTLYPHMPLVLTTPPLGGCNIYRPQ